MPRHSRRIAARQAELARRKRRAGPRPAVAQPAPGEPAEPATETATTGTVAATTQAAAAPHPTQAAGDLPAFELPQRAAAAPRPRARAAAGVASSPTALPAAPYLRRDLAIVGVLTGLMAVLLIVLALLLG